MVVRFLLRSSQYARAFALAAAALVAGANGVSAQAPAGPAVGVLLSDVESGPSAPMRNIYDEETMRKMPAKVRAQMEAQRQAVQSQYAGAMNEMQQRMRAIVPGAAQRNWVVMLQRAGIPAVAINAATPEAAKQEAEVKNVRWLLSTSVSHGPVSNTSATTVIRGVSMAQQVPKADLTVRYSLVDTAGHELIPPRTATHEGIADPTSAGGADAWALDGDDMVQAVASALPPGTVHHGSPSDMLPKIPRMANSVRYDLAITTTTDYHLKAFGMHIGKPEEPQNKTAVLEFADGFIATQDSDANQAYGLIYTPGASTFLFVDDKNKRFSNMGAEDLEAARSFSQIGGGLAGKPTRLVALSGGTAGSKMYDVVRDPAGPHYQQRPGTKTTVEIQFGRPLEQWQQAVQQITTMFNGTGAALVSFGTDAEVSAAIWAELAANPAPPAHIAIHTVPVDKSAGNISEETEVRFQQNTLPKGADFTIPSTYHWSTSPILQGMMFM